MGEARWSKGKHRRYRYGSIEPKRVGNQRSNGCALWTRLTVKLLVRTFTGVQFGWPIGMPLVRSLNDGLWEVRSVLPNHRIARLILCFALVVLHGFIPENAENTRERAGVG